MRHRILVVPLAAVVLLVAALPASAAKPAPQTSSEDAAYYAGVLDAVESMKSAEKSQAEVDAMLESEYGWVLVAAGEDDITTMASQNFNVDMKTPTVYYNTQQGRYEAAAWFYWKDCGTDRCWRQDIFIGRNIGGYDGFGLSVAKLVTRKTQYFSTYTESNVRTTYSNPWDADDSGATFRNQDSVDGAGRQYNWDHGSLVYAFTIRAGCPRGDYQINSKLAHTWSGARVDAITVSTGGIAVTFGGSSERWQAVNPVPKSWYPCGT